ncbi:MAG: hypothetical protein AVDCRST_MAG14-1314 [uncultured Rubrobacteraceae bacterium]|uniref:Uncharacterized protein n=1 Tax=uncultured Rubrobacteraceae bacterium TaxID=349277 RepID=A0A6J4QW60_9ACTN|nr:MAG: hypothetical protein AVDCRST_MAG14-1314 [uncultured Rubrobacteraceae bacterium]
MSEDFEGREISVKEYGERTLNAARLYSLLRQEREIEDPWHIMVLAICSFDQVHLKDGWEFVLTNRKDIEDVGQLFERSNSQEEFREGLIELKERDLRERLKREDLR